MTSINQPSWSLFEKIGFRFSFVYFLLFIAFQNNSAYPFWYDIFTLPLKWTREFIPWLGENVFHLSEPVFIGMTGSGDTTYDFLVLFCIASLALLCTLVWSFIDRKRQNYSKLYYWLTVAIRYYVGFMLISYGYSKVIQLQFPSPSPYRLIEPYGESSPMGLAWTFLGFSKGYNMFMGIAELLAGLLLFRKTMTFGAFLTLMTAMNIMAVNYFYDIPVKIVSTHLVIMTLFLLIPNIKRLTLFFFTDINTKLKVIKRPNFKKGLNIAMNSLKAVLVGYVIIYGFIETLDAQKQYGSKAPKPDLYGVYEVTDFIINGDTITDYKNEKLWKSIAVQWPGSLQIRRFSGSKISYYGTEKDSLTDDRLKLTRWGKADESFYMNYKKIDSTGLNFNFIFDGDTIQGYTKRFYKEDFILNSRGFHWISEQAYNR
ncbi:hypothetical protein [Winogradskyella flava]|uniref:DoxX family protein n=1 Tax=Winogradskyella flava TaxID=1884876 RepID=A0A842IY07_9FLAO|nr:hypothetical protein [Winogradskyella flava]MBC2846563.1 hypothetical protein [Winogradskyella flava]